MDRKDPETLSMKKKHLIASSDISEMVCIFHYFFLKKFNSSVQR